MKHGAGAEGSWLGRHSKASLPIARCVSGQRRLLPPRAESSALTNSGFWFVLLFSSCSRILSSLWSPHFLSSCTEEP